MMVYRFALGIIIAAALLTACGGSQPPIGSPGAVPQSLASTRYKSLYSFGARYDGQQPKAALIDLNGTFYGTTYGGGKHGPGTVFSINTTGGEKVLYSFQGGNDGGNPSAGLIAVKGTLYGTTEYGGEHSNGTVFRISTTGAEKALHQFGGYFYGQDGGNPVAALIYVRSRLYGTTLSGGFNECCGTVFRISTSGKEKVLYSFDGGFGDGANPAASLIDVNGTLYGTTQLGGQLSSEGGGTVFRTTRSGGEAVLYKFDPYGPNGAAPLAGLTKVNGTLYGTTSYGGPDSGGSAFSITKDGDLTYIHNFGSGSDGSRSVAPLLNVRDSLYGTTESGGIYGKGTILKMSFSGKEKVLHSFGYGSDGATPLAGLIDVNGTLYGTTSAGGTYGDGTVFALKLR